MGIRERKMSKIVSKFYDENDFLSNSNPDAKIVLKYFDCHGFRGLLTRMVLDLGEIEHREKIVKLTNWSEVKPTTLLGYLPELTVNGETFAHTPHICSYLSKIGKMDKLTDIEELKSGMVVESMIEIVLKLIVPAFVAANGLKD